ncbi:Vitamin K-dependent gamma-carboxylase [Mycobacterium sp. JS623]|uniref:HTTM domain-containing protein n=1 Tax=Mycobacterium sp. JS623 TaxID=212767 RepID=UPI0002A5B744|nr:HTTM domain-containing protein [Mycobacterium sp. JS623]AGB25470.1 Vitamin K-dependent gamma-carboxylase [Mycobacterium sp. JS623]
MTTPKRSRAASQLDVVRNWWASFWFSPEPAYALGLVRMAFGALMVYVTLDLRPVLTVLFSKDGPVPAQPTARDFHWINAYQLGLFQIWDGNTALLIGWIALLLSAISLTVGWHSRFAALAVWILFLSFIRRNPGIFNAGDHVMANTALILTISACGAALSLDQRRRTGRFWSAQERLHWPIRLIQVQLALIYFFTAQTKLIGPAWNDGTAVSFPWRIYQEWAILPAPLWVAEQPFLVNVATWSTIAIELSLAILVWNKRLRYPVLVAGVVLHIAIWLTLNIAFFSIAMLILYLAWVPWQTVRDIPDKAKRIWSRLKRRTPRRNGSVQNLGGVSPGETIQPETATERT